MITDSIIATFVNTGNINSFVLSDTGEISEEIILDLDVIICANIESDIDAFRTIASRFFQNIFFFNDLILLTVLHFDPISHTVQICRVILLKSN